MAVSKAYRIILLCLWSVVTSLAATVVEDTKNRFVLSDEVMDTNVYPCMDQEGSSVSGFAFSPENVAYEDGNAMPFRVYRVAVPNKQVPSVSVSNVKSVPFKKNFCKDSPIRFGGVTVSPPFLRDGLWVVDVKVPLYEKAGGSFTMRKSFKLRVDFATAAPGVNPGKRALSRVLNPKAAARFGVSQDARRKSLRRAASDLSSVTFLAQIVVGDKNVATMSEDGFYAVDFESINKSLVPYNRQGELYGIPVENVRVYGASPDTLADMGPGAELRSPSQLFEIPIEVRDNNANGIFDKGDVLYFVGYGNGFWKRCDSEDSAFVNGKMDYFHSYSPYSYYQYFLFGWSNQGKGLRLSDKLKSPAAAGKKVDWMRYVRAEKDSYLRDTYYGKALEWEATTGKEWFWMWHSRFDSTEVTDMELSMPQTKDLTGVVDGGKQYVAVSYYPYRSIYTDKAEKPNDQVKKRSFSGESYTSRMNGIHFDFTVNQEKLNSSKRVLLPGGNFMLETSNLRANGNTYGLTMLPNDFQYDRFDGYTLAYQWTPVVDSAEWLLPGKVSGVIEIPVGTASDLRVMKFRNMEPVGLLEIVNGVAKDSVLADDDNRYLAYREGAKHAPFKVEGIPAAMNGALSDISKINSQTEYLIIAPNEFMASALTLGKFRSDGSAISTIPTTVVSVEDIYRRYTGGRLSPVAIRNYIAYARDVCPSLKYVLLAGSGHYDYRGINPKLGKNYIPPFEKEDAVTEDFFAALDSGEVVRYGNDDLDLAVGRIPVSSVEEFSDYIQKAKDYEEVGTFDHGAWRSNLLLSADDADNGGSLDVTKHSYLQEQVALAIDSLYEKTKFKYNLKKVYLITYPSDAAGQKKEAANDFIDALNQGSLMTSYFGHGSKTDWAAEGLLKPSYISRLSNKKRYTILNSFSCTVGRFDEGQVRSLSEEFLLAKGVGSIASVGAARETFASYNQVMGRGFMVNSLGESGARIGDALVKAKNTVVSGYSEQRYNNEHYLLLGEPVIQMMNPSIKISFDQSLDTIKGLDNMKISGSVEGLQNGIINISINEGNFLRRLPTFVEKDSIDVSFYGTLIYSQEVPVRGGRFETNFITPRKINYGDTAAELNAWVYSSDIRDIGATARRGIAISGISSYADSINDVTPPTIEIQSCYSNGVPTSFADNQKIQLQSPACLQIVIQDSTALDFREQADEGISVEVVGHEDPFHPNPFIEQTSNRVMFRKTFSPEAYPEGVYQFSVRAQDVLGNMVSKTLYLDITGEMKTGLADVFNMPNPLGKKGTTFYFKNLAVDRNSRVDIFIYNQNGRLVKVIKNAVSGVTHWNGRDNHGRLLANGLYHYVVRSEVEATEVSKKKTFTKKQKLLISR